MQLITLLPAILAVGTYAACHNSGETWGDKQVALDAAQNQCYGGALSGFFEGHQRKERCVNGNGKRFNFRVYRLQPSEGNLSPDECYTFLAREINGCNRGGDRSYANWRYA